MTLEVSKQGNSSNKVYNNREDHGWINDWSVIDRPRQRSWWGTVNILALE